MGSGRWYGTTAWRSAPSHGTCSTAGTSLETRRFTRGARAFGERPSETPPTSRSTGSSARSSPRSSARRGGTSRSCRSARRAGRQRWPPPAGPSAQRSLTSRNWLGSVRGALARWNPDLLGSWEGGSNLTLVRGPDHGRPRRPSRARAAPPSRATDDGLRQARLRALRGEPAREHAAPPGRRRTCAALPRRPSPGPPIRR